MSVAPRDAASNADSATFLLVDLNGEALIASAPAVESMASLLNNCGHLLSHFAVAIPRLFQPLSKLIPVVVSRPEFVFLLIRGGNQQLHETSFVCHSQKACADD